MIIGREVEYKVNNDYMSSNTNVGLVLDKIRCSFDLGWSERDEKIIDCYLIKNKEGIVIIPCTRIEKLIES